jgi:hypothetical protein
VRALDAEAVALVEGAEVADYISINTANVDRNLAAVGAGLIQELGARKQAIRHNSWNFGGDFPLGVGSGGLGVRRRSCG